MCPSILNITEFSITKGILSANKTIPSIYDTTFEMTFPSYGLSISGEESYLIFFNSNIAESK